MPVFRIECHYTLPTLLREFLGARLAAIFFQKGSLALLKPVTLASTSSVIMSFFEDKNRARRELQFDSKGHDSYAGRLYGIEVSELKIKHTSTTPVFEQLGYNFSISDDFGAISKIVGIGEIRKEVVLVEERKDEVKEFFPRGSTLPEAITIDKETLEIVGFLFETGKWLYFFADGEGHFRLEFDIDLPPIELTRRWDFAAMEKHMQVLQVFE
jgi:hypothetical protein